LALAATTRASISPGRRCSRFRSSEFGRLVGATDQLELRLCHGNGRCPNEEVSEWRNFSMRTTLLQCTQFAQVVPCKRHSPFCRWLRALARIALSMRKTTGPRPGSRVIRIQSGSFSIVPNGSVDWRGWSSCERAANRLRGRFPAPPSCLVRARQDSAIERNVSMPTSGPKAAPGPLHDQPTPPEQDPPNKPLHDPAGDPTYEPPQPVTEPTPNPAGDPPPERPGDPM
jgi:hypothetical protein